MTQLEFSLIVKKINGFKFPKVDLVVGIETGGVVPAALVAYTLGKDLALLKINYRDENNQPRHARPVLLKPWQRRPRVKRILLVDDVSVTGQTLQIAKSLLKPCQVETFVLKGKADHVLFPKIKDCVDWPWRQLKR